jgi:hypothetical protein
MARPMRPFAPATAILIGEVTVFPWLAIFPAERLFTSSIRAGEGDLQLLHSAPGAKPYLLWSLWSSAAYQLPGSAV